MASSTKKRVVDEDVDDLDDLLDDFTVPPPAPASAPIASTSNSTTNNSLHSIPAPEDDGDFANDLAQGMEALMRELAASGAVPPPPGTSSTQGSSTAAKELTEDEKKQAEAFAAAWEALLVEGMNGAGAGGEGAPTTTASSSSTGATGAGGSTAAKNGAEDAFGKTIREAMERMQAGEAEMRADASASSSDPLAALLASLGDGEGGSEDDLSGMLEGMMGQLLSKEILYEPLKELHDKFPAYLKEHAELAEGDRKRYVAQQECAGRIVAVFEDPKYSDEDAECSTKVITLMNEMQTHGSPPSELMGEMPAGFEAGPDGLPKMPDGCVMM